MKPKHQHVLGRSLYCAIVACTCAGVLTGGCPPPPDNEHTVPDGTPTGYLKLVMDQFHDFFYVYSDANAAGNHFTTRVRMNSPGGDEAVPFMDDFYAEDEEAGLDCIECSFLSRGDNWGGWYFMTSVWQEGDPEPVQNWGDYPNAGYDLQGATRLTFRARGRDGGERVELFCLGVGRDPDTGLRDRPHPDSWPKVSLGFVTLSNEWHTYTISLTNKDLRYVIGGFAWVTNAPKNFHRDITFYLDDIRYHNRRPQEPRFLVSYETIPSDLDFDMVLRNFAYTYDNALALLAFLAGGDTERAGILADALVYVQEHDPYYDDGRLRSAYQGGDLTLPPGWRPNGQAGLVRFPGWYDPELDQWFGHDSLVNTHTGDTAWAMLALLAYYENVGDQKYLAAAQRLGQWVHDNCHDERGPGGYTGGFEGWLDAPRRLLHKSTENNIDLYPAFERLYLITGNETWRARAQHAKEFVLAMWDEAEGKFWTGTTDDGETVYQDVIPLDVQAWAVLALGPESAPFWAALDYAEIHHRVGEGFDFNQDRDGIWYEGTAHMAAAYHAVGRMEEWQNLIEVLTAALSPSGGLPAADRDGLTTGFGEEDRSPWLYYRRAHVGATAWLVLAEHNVNPFWMGSD